MTTKKGTFRFAYFTDKYKETCEFYSEKLGLNLEFSWDRNNLDKGAVFSVESGLIEVINLHDNEELKQAGFDFRKPEGAFMVVEVFDVNERFENYKSKGMVFKQELTNQSWGHRSFSVTDPNGVVLFFYEDLN